MLTSLKHALVVDTIQELAPMAEPQANVVEASTAGARLVDSVVGIEALESSAPASGCRVFTHFNGPTDELSGLAVGMCVLDPGSTPHPPHQRRGAHGR